MLIEFTAIVQSEHEAPEKILRIVQENSRAKINAK